MDKNIICIKNHDKMVKKYKYLKSDIGKKKFKKRVEILKSKKGKEVLLIVLKSKWNEINELIKNIYDINLKIINKLTNKTNKTNKIKNKKNVENVNYLLKNIKKPEQLGMLIDQIINNKNLYNYLLIIFKILSDKTECIKLFI